MTIRSDALQHGLARPGTADAWRATAFLVVAVLWIPASALMVFLAYVGIVGVGSEHGHTPGLIDDPTSGSAIAALATAVGVFGLALVLLVALARWSWPSRRRAATAWGVVAAGWMPLLAAVVVSVP